MMREKPILFSGPMVRAILDDRKGQTRRVVKPQPTERDLSAGTRDGIFPFIHKQGTADWFINGPLRIGPWKCPYGHPGDRLWVRETWHGAVDGDEPNYGIIYKASWPHGPGDAFKRDDRAGRYFIGSTDGKWRPSIFMPRWASRIDLEITDIRVERVNEITPDDAFREGFELHDSDPITGDVCLFSSLWDSINGKKYPWESNPHVWVISFKRIKP